MSEIENSKHKRTAIINIVLGAIVTMLNFIGVADLTIKHYVGIGVGLMSVLLGVSILHRKQKA